MRCSRFDAWGVVGGVVGGSGWVGMKGEEGRERGEGRIPFCIFVFVGVWGGNYTLKNSAPRVRILVSLVEKLECTLKPYLTKNLCFNQLLIEMIQKNVFFLKKLTYIA